MKNYYQILGLSEGATIEQVRKAYKLYAQKLHPDKHKNDKFFEDKFKEIKEAHDFLIEKIIEEENKINTEDVFEEKIEYQSPEKKSNHEQEKASKPSLNRTEIKSESPVGATLKIILGFVLPFVGAAFVANATESGVAAGITFVLLLGFFIFNSVKS